MTTHITATTTSTSNDHGGGSRFTLRQAVVSDIKRNTRQLRDHLTGSVVRIGSEAVAVGLFFLGGQDQRRMVEWTRRHNWEGPR